MADHGLEGSERHVNAPARSDQLVANPSQQPSTKRTKIFQRAAMTNEDLTLEEFTKWSKKTGEFVKDLNELFSWFRERRDRYYNQKRQLTTALDELAKNEDQPAASQ
jgi:hypothetical protein